MKVFKMPLGAGLVLGLVALTLLVPTAAKADRPGTSLQDCGNGIQFLGFSDALNKTKYGDFDIAELSGLTYDSDRGTFYAVADRAGAVPSHVFTLDIPFSAESLGVPRVLAATVLKNSGANSYNGTNLDAEGMVVHNNELIIASEGGSGNGEQPEIVRFSSTGEYLGDLPVPARFLIGKNNLSFESLAISPNGHSLYTMFEGPLAGDGKTSDNRSRLRILRYEDRGPDGFQPAEEYFYLTEPGRTTDELGACDLIALSEDDLLVLERGFVSGQGNTVRAYRVSTDGATDVSQQPRLDVEGLLPLSKRLVIDLADCPPSGATSPQVQPNPLLDNFEAMALGPKLPGGRQALVLVSDDNNSSAQITRIVAVAIPIRDLVGDDNDFDGGNTSR